MARRTGIHVPDFEVLPASSSSEAPGWLAMKRFDITPAGGRYHVQTVSGLLDAPHTEPCFDYQDLLQVTNAVCRTQESSQQMFRRALFNLLAMNRDDHTKNTSFLCTDTGEWTPTPAYDLVFNRLPEHNMAYARKGRKPSKAAVLELARLVSLSLFETEHMLEQIRDALSLLPRIAKDIGAGKATIKRVKLGLNEAAQENSGLF